MNVLLKMQALLRIVMKSPVERTLLFVEEIVSKVSEEFEHSLLVCDQRQSTFQNGVDVIEVRVYDDNASHGKKFTPVAVINVVDPENPCFQVKSMRSVNGGEMAAGITQYTSGQFEEGMMQCLEKVHSPHARHPWVFLEFHGKKNEGKIEIMKSNLGS